MAKTQRLDIVTPEKVVFSEEIDFVVAPGADGELGILPEHAPLVTALKVGTLRVQQGGKFFKVAVSGGFMEVKNSRIVVLADTAERADQIDVERAKAAKQRAEQRLNSKGSEIDVHRAEIALHKAINRIKAAE
ncbi:ATP synthase F1 subcomplex epsilon subunit [Desulforamulus reducens MI-1]|uniref:ATP synthase epsilon chain n=1 Tax=Desulforamulus reducens (strain ATCC BAA-1160 / DSM 100696 / MI-1) TaxID=349161 RepID=ATPE_DESRM|nr:F0F1 ATP synthase subunit epsilon [Desulforamulus reducens]A4J998.1 RecName: Full=ATP synthase epsilon chain; AltName: Full=ATP synthase F1 sector epsilon subunit; AltName: Full=F-ATPase epsilon subunit [Desulforamulus reducens MI-1]ABO51651.1 ATP synthase F1 subcomplex epsilon subunit [Desulforamulus reducens MI-1]